MTASRGFCAVNPGTGFRSDTRGHGMGEEREELRRRAEEETEAKGQPDEGCSQAYAAQKGRIRR
jgi:hypothetical protein